MEAGRPAEALFGIRANWEQVESLPQEKEDAVSDIAQNTLRAEGEPPPPDEKALSSSNVNPLSIEVEQAIENTDAKLSILGRCLSSAVKCAQVALKKFSAAKAKLFEAKGAIESKLMPKETPGIKYLQSAFSIEGKDLKRGDPLKINLLQFTAEDLKTFTLSLKNNEKEREKISNNLHFTGLIFSGSVSPKEALAIKGFMDTVGLKTVVTNAENFVDDPKTIREILSGLFSEREV